jgi:chromosome segregation ATPase
MTSAGRILVIVIMAVAVLFLGISTVAISTSRNWTADTKGAQKKVEELKKKLDEVQKQADAAKDGLENAKRDFEARTKQVNAQISTLRDENKRNLDQITAVRGQLVTAQDTAKSALEQVQARREATAKLHAERAAVEKQGEEFKQHRGDLTDRIRELERELDTATKGNADLQARQKD